MPNIEVQDDLYSWINLRPEIGRPMAEFSMAVYEHSILPLAEREMARLRIAKANDCILCLNTRDATAADSGVDESLYDHNDEWATWSGFTERQRMAAEFGERFAHEPGVLKRDEEFWGRLRAEYSDEEIADLAMCCAQWIANGRLMSVLDVGQTCTLVLNED